MVKLVIVWSFRTDGDRETLASYRHTEHAALVTKHAATLRIRRYVQPNGSALTLAVAWVTLHRNGRHLLAARSSWRSAQRRQSL
jgi:hypothetical protein